MSEKKREFEEEEEEASSTSVSPLKKTKLDDSDTSSDSHDVVVDASSSSSSSSSVSSSAALALYECSSTSAGEENDQSWSISSGCFISESKVIATNSPTFVTDLEAHQNSESETKSSTLITSNFRKEASPVLSEEGLGETTTEMESSSTTERKDDRRKPPKVSKTPTPAEIEGFFAELENEDDKKKQFIEKYNFDIVNDEPLQGRYKWDRLNP